MSEAELQAAVIELARLRNWRVAHFRPVRVQRKNGSVYHETPVAADGKGFPDLVLARAGAVLFIELKAEKGRLSPEQEAWGKALSHKEVHATYFYWVWRPEDWTSGRIEEWLR